MSQSVEKSTDWLTGLKKKKKKSGPRERSVRRIDTTTCDNGIGEGHALNAFQVRGGGVQVHRTRVSLADQRSETPKPAVRISAERAIEITVEDNEKWVMMIKGRGREKVKGKNGAERLEQLLIMMIVSTTSEQRAKRGRNRWRWVGR